MHEYTPVTDPEKFFDLGACPLCGHKGIFVEKTTHPVRRYKCKGCNNTWKGVMIFLAYKNSLRLAADYHALKEDLDKSLPFL